MKSKKASCLPFSLIPSEAESIKSTLDEEEYALDDLVRNQEGLDEDADHD